MKGRIFTNAVALVLLTLLFQKASLGQKTYHWIASGGGTYSFTSNWNPVRTSPNQNDTLIFNNGGTYTVSNITTDETVARVIVSNNTKVTFTAPTSTAITYTIKGDGGPGYDLLIDSDCELNLDGTKAITLVLSAGATGSVSGSMTFASVPHVLNVVDVSGLSFNSGAVFTQNCTGFVFTNQDNPNVVIFKSGSSLIFKLGSNPFGLTAPASKIVFEKGSLYSHQSSGTPSFTGRIYSNFEYKYSAGTLTSIGLNCDNFTLTDGTVSITSNSSPVLFVKGNFNIASGKTFNYAPTASNQSGIVFGGGIEQQINNNGTLTFGQYANVAITDGTTVTLNAGDISTSGKFRVMGTLNALDKVISGTGSYLMDESTVTLTGTTAIGGTSITSASSIVGVDAGMLIAGTGIESGTYVTGASGTTIYISKAATAVGSGISFTLSKVVGTLKSGHANGINGNIATSGANVINVKSNIEYNGSVPQVTGTLLPTSFKNLTINNSTGVTLSAAATVTNALTFTNGNLDLGSNNLTIGSSGSISGADYSKFIVTSGAGVLRLNTNSGTVIYPIGSSSTSYSPFITTNNTAGDVLDVYVHNSITNATLDDTRCVQLEWMGHEGTTGGNTGTVSFLWNITDQGINFDPAQQVYLGVWDGSKYIPNLVSVSGTGPYIATIAAPASYPLYPVVLGNFGAFPANAPGLNPDITETDVDHNIEVTFNHDALWESAITKISVNGSDLASTDWELIPPSKATIASIILKPTPTGNEELKKSGTWNIIVYATGYPDATLSQPVASGALVVANSTINNPVLSPPTSKTVVISAKDQYGNPVSGYIFKYDATVKNDDNTSAESYTIAGTVTGSSASSVSLPVTDALGSLSFDITLPATIDPLDGILVQVKLNDGTTNFGSELKYYGPKLTATATLNESTLNNATIVLTLQNESFVDNSLDKSNFVLHNAPIGLTISDVTYNTDAEANLILAFDSTDFDIDSTNFNISVNGSELALGNSLISNNITITSVNLATVVTNAQITTNGLTTATWGGVVTSNGGAPLIQMGVCWNTTGDPTVSDSKTEEIAKGPSATIVGAMTGLTPVTKYYVRAYATNYDGTNYGDVYDFTTYTPAPNFTTNYPKSANIANESFDVVVSTDAVGKVYYLCLASGTAAPTSSYIKSNGTTIDVTAANSDFSSSITGLTYSTSYDVYFITENADATVILDTPVKLTETTADAPLVSIHDIQYTTDVSGNSPYLGKTIKASGTITAIKYNSSEEQQGFYIQSSVGAWNGVFVSTTTPTVSVGYIVTVTGTIMENSTFTQFSPVDNVNLDNTTNTTLPDAYEVTTDAAKNEMYEGVLVIVKRALCSSNNGSGTNVVSDGSGDLTVYKNLYSTLSLTVDHRYDITGILSWFINSSIYALFPRDANDINDVTGINDNYDSKLAVYPNPFTNEIRFDGYQNIKSIIITSVTGQVVKKEAILNGLVITSELPSGIYFVTLINSNGERTTVKMVKQ